MFSLLLDQQCSSYNKCLSKKGALKLLTLLIDLQQYIEQQQREAVDLIARENEDFMHQDENLNDENPHRTTTPISISSKKRITGGFQVYF
jgi:hypothetical protein